MTRHTVQFALILTLLVVPFTLEAQVAITRAPGGMMQVLGDPPETDVLGIGNAGQNPVTINFAASGGFFTLSANSLTLQPRTAGAITIRATATEPGPYQGSITISASGFARTITVPVRLFIGQRPFGTVRPGLGSNLIILQGLPGRSHSGQINASNFGTAIMTCMLVADVPWINAPTDIVGVEPRGTKNFAFEVNPSLRPDGATPLGAFVGTLSMLNIRGTEEDTAIADTSKTTATVVDITKASVVPQQPLPLAAGEIASFLAGVTDINGVSNLFITNRTSNVVSGAQLFYSAVAGSGAAPSLLAGLGQMPASTSAWFPYAPTSVFDVANQTGSVQLRTAQAGQVGLAGHVSAVPDGQNLYVTTLPVLTSTASAPSGDTLVFSGVEKSTSASTDLHIQETSGFAGTFTVEFLDRLGAMIGTPRNESIGAFGYVALPNVVPTDALSVRVRNTSSGSARLAGYAAVIDASTQDRWTITDPRRITPSSEVFLPMPAQDNPASVPALDVWVTNTSASPAQVTYSTSSSGPAKRRAVRRGSTSSDSTDKAMLATATLQPGETRQSIFNAPIANGHIRVSGPAGALAVSGRIKAASPSRPGRFGSGIPALPSMTASPLGVKKQFPLSDDAPGALRSLLLLETSGQPATVRVTMHFNFPGGSTTTGQATASKTYEVPAGQLLTIPNLSTSILGPSRNDLGRLFNILVDIEVTGGGGRVISYLQSGEVSGDVTIAVD
jgi:hypothetical protein